MVPHRPYYENFKLKGALIQANVSSKSLKFKVQRSKSKDLILRDKPLNTKEYKIPESGFRVSTPRFVPQGCLQRLLK